MPGGYQDIGGVTVTAPRVGGGFGGALGGIGSLLGAAIGAGSGPAPTMADYYRSNPGALSDAINRMFPQTSSTPATSQTPAANDSGNTVEGVDVVGNRPAVPGVGAGAAALAAGAGLAGLGALTGGSTVPGGTQSVPAGTDPTTLPAAESDPLTVTPAVGSAVPMSPLTMAALAAGVGALAPGQTVNTGTPINGTVPTTVTPDVQGGLSPLETAIAAGGLGGLAAGQIPSGSTPDATNPLASVAAGGAAGVIPPFVKDLLPLVPLLPLLGGGSGGGVAGATDALKGVADNATALSNRLGNVATAGFAGDIGGRGLNSIARMVRNAQAAIRQRYAAMNMSGSTAEEDDLNAASQAGVDQQFKIGQQMAQTGLAAIAALTGQSAAIYTSLLNAATTKDTALGTALSNFAAAVTH